MNREMARAEATRGNQPKAGDAVIAEAEQRIQRQIEEVAETEKKEPLRRRILAALVDGTATPTELGKRLGSPAPSISRILKEFREAGLVVSEGDEADRRRSHYSLTAAGEVQLNKHTAFGAKEKPPPPLSGDQTVQLLRTALDRAVRIRREANRLGEAIARLRAVIREAEKIGARDIALEGMVELAKTLRQDRRPEEQEELWAAYDEQVDRLNDIALGNDADYGAELAVPAAAHLKYSLGRAGDRRGEDLPSREAHLTAACSLYGQLVSNSQMPVTANWLARQAWSVVSLAGNLRKQTQLEKALRLATMAKRSFDLLEDDYGRAHCLFMFGFCLRLLGEFREAWVCLERAYKIADIRSFERIRADTLMQMGEVKRCLGDLDEAREMLDDALGQADGMKLLVTQAFAQSALGAVEFQQEHLSQARDYLAGAESLFQGCQHVEGMALNARRQAAVAREIAVESSKPSYAAVERLIESAYEGYADLHSPAGIAACAIEEGRVRMLRKGGRVQPVVERLRALLADRSQREILELDPWVPQLLTRFAEDAGDEALLGQSEGVMATAQEKLAERGAQGVERVALVVEELVLEDEDEIAPSAAEMGGESRRDPSAFEGIPGQGLPAQELQLVAA
jgi:DNA-binding MarR family transcriptional regulator